jgi:hypothetical protein
MSTSKLTTGGHRRAMLSAVVLGTAGALALALASTAAAEPGHGGHGGSGQPPAPATAAPRPAKGPSTFLTAELTGDQEVPVPNGPAVADNDGSATALVQIKGDRVTFALRWKGIAAPSLGHIHEGKAGVNGGVKVGLFGTAMPATVTAAAGQVTVNDAQLAQDLRRNPSGFYVNLHTAEFPGGAVRGQLKPATRRTNPLEIIRGGKLRAPANGDQEVPAADGKAVGDPDGFAVSFLQPKGDTVDYSLAWVNIGAPTLGHVHQGRFGQNGPVKVNLFTTPMPATVFAASGTVNEVEPGVASQLRRDPTGFYANLHTAEFPGGAVRGQFLG